MKSNWWRWRLFLARLKYWGWTVFAKGLLGFIYLSVISDGLRYVVPLLAQKLYRLPGLGGLREYEAFYRIDLAPFFAVFLLLAVFSSAQRFLLFWLGDMPAEDLSRGAKFILATGGVILFGDACLFYIA